LQLLPHLSSAFRLVQDQAGKFEFLWNHRDRLKQVKRFIIAADGDAPGRRLAAELVRRPSPTKCSGRGVGREARPIDWSAAPIGLPRAKRSCREEFLRLIVRRA
jgi:hypothetical protein